MQKPFIRSFLKNKRGWTYLFSGGLVLCTALLGLFIGSVSISVSTILSIMVHKLTGLLPLDLPVSTEMIIWEIRFPRLVLAFLVGASLALAGAAFQGLLRNPLADPYTLGVSSGAALGAVLAISFQWALWGMGMFTVPLVAIVGGCISLGVVLLLTHLSGRGLETESIILAGIIVSSFIGSLISLLIALSGEELRQIIYWLMGSVAMRGWSHVQLLLPFFIGGALLILLHYRELNALALGEEAAYHIGMEVRRKKLWIVIGASLLTGAAVSVSGTIGFVGLVIPHLVRMMIGPNHRHLLIISMLIGGSFLILADLVARVVIAPQELPLGVITALIGAPVFGLLFVKERLGRRSIR